MPDIKVDKDHNLTFDLETPQVDLVQTNKTFNGKPTFTVDIDRTTYEIISKFINDAYISKTEISIEDCKVIFTLASEE